MNDELILPMAAHVALTALLYAALTVARAPHPQTWCPPSHFQDSCCWACWFPHPALLC